MPLDEVRPFTLHFVVDKDHGPLSNDPGLAPFSFPRAIANTAAIMTGWDLEYRDDGDGTLPAEHWIALMQAEVHTTIAGSSAVIVDGQIGLRDRGGFPSQAWGHNYTGTISGLLLVELVPEGDLPSPTLTITGAEASQVTQFFRSTVQATLETNDGFPFVLLDRPPDNSVLLIEGKATAIRLYVDFEPLAGFAAPSLLAGTAEVSGAFGTQVINSQNQIIPRSDAAIDRTRVDDTLNFVLPPGLCHGNIAVRLQAKDPASGVRTDYFEARLSFQQSRVLRIFQVGMSLEAGAGNDMVAAPSALTCASSLNFARKIYPVQALTIDGYQTLSRPRPTAADLAQIGIDEANSFLIGCNDALTDLRGSSIDFYLGYYDFSAISSEFPGPLAVVGGASQPHRTATAPAGDQFAAAHELTHLIPINLLLGEFIGHTDDPTTFPMYQGLPAGSIGEIGTDPGSVPITVFDPALVKDIMSPAERDLPTTWIEPHEYLTIADALQEPSIGGMIVPGGLTLRADGNAYAHQLMLGLTILRDRTVRLRPSFHFPAPPGPTPGRSSRFWLDLLDDHGEVLWSQPLAGRPTDEDESFPLVVRASVQFPSGARLIVVLEDGREIWRQEIPEPPALRDVSYQQASDHFALSWESAPAAGGDLWYLVHWQDADRSWRGAAERSRAKSLSLPYEFLRNRQVLPVRILATSGIATGSHALELELKQPPSSQSGKPQIFFTNDAGLSRSGRASYVSAEAIDQFGRSVHDGVFVWSDQSGRQIGTGPDLPDPADPIGPLTVSLHLSPGEVISLAVPPSKGPGQGVRPGPLTARGGDTP